MRYRINDKISYFNKKTYKSEEFPNENQLISTFVKPTSVDVNSMGIDPILPLCPFLLYMLFTIGFLSYVGENSTEICSTQELKVEIKFFESMKYLLQTVTNMFMFCYK